MNDTYTDIFGRASRDNGGGHLIDVVLQLRRFQGADLLLTEEQSRTLRDLWHTIMVVDEIDYRAGLAASGISAETSAVLAEPQAVTIDEIKARRERMRCEKHRRSIFGKPSPENIKIRVLAYTQILDITRSGYISAKTAYRRKAA